MTQTDHPQTPARPSFAWAFWIFLFGIGIGIMIGVVIGLGLAEQAMLIPPELRGQ